jgi:hypothetical protein
VVPMICCWSMVLVSQVMVPMLALAKASLCRVVMAGGTEAA